MPRFFGSRWLPMIATICLTVSVASAAPPAYLVLKGPIAPLPPPQAGTSSQPGREIPTGSPGYAYGWFGVQPRQHWSRHFGYYRNYTQWSAK